MKGGPSMLRKMFYIAGVVLLLTACMQASGSEEIQVIDFPLSVSNVAPAIEKGELTYGLVSDEPFEGTLNRVFYSGQPDAEIMQFFDESLLATDEDGVISNDGAATYKLSKDHQTITIRIREGVNWHDGEPVKASDLLYTYELLGHPDYTGSRYTFVVSSIVGMADYHEGKTDKITGIKILDDRTLSITFEQATPSILSGIWTAPTPRHYVGDVTSGELTMDELVSSEKIRTSPIGFGPFKVSKIVPGESVLFKRNEQYWRGRPALQSIVVKVVSTASVLQALEKGEIDIASIPVDQYDNARQMAGIEILADIDTSYSYIGFKLGKWDAKKKENVRNPDAKLADKAVRQAMWHAMDNDSIGKMLYKGLRFPATTLIVPVFKAYHDTANKGRPYDPEKARTLLNQAGYIDRDGDGLREDPKGKPFVLTFASMASGESAELIAQYYIQNWADVGLDVQLLDGRLHEFHSFYERVQKDDPAIDLFQAAWGTGSDPDPEGLWGRSAVFNYTRYVSDENDALLEKGTSEKAFDTDYRVAVYNEWQQLMVDEVPAAPTVYRYALIGVNQRVVNYTINGTSPNKYPWRWGVSQ